MQEICRFLGFAVAICDHKKYIIFGKILGFLIEMIISEELITKWLK